MTIPVSGLPISRMALSFLMLSWPLCICISINPAQKDLVPFAYSMVLIIAAIIYYTRPASPVTKFFEQGPFLSDDFIL